MKTALANMESELRSQSTSTMVAGRLAVFSTLAACFALLVEYILLSRGGVGYFGFIGFLMCAAIVLWGGFFAFAKKYQSEWYDQMTENNKDLQLQALFSTLNPWPVLRFDRYGQLISKNSCAKTFFYTLQADTEKQRSVFDFFPEITKDAWQGIVHQESHFELEYNRSGYWLCFYFRSHSQLGVINVYGFDVTSYKRQQLEAEQKLKSTARDSHHKNQLLYDTFDALRRPAKSLKKNIAAGMGVADPLVKNDLILLTDIISRLEDLTELDIEHFRQHVHSFDCRSMIEKLSQNAAKQVYELETEIVLDCDLGHHDFIIADSRRLQQVMEAMLRFAVNRSLGQFVLVKVRWVSNVGLTSSKALDCSAGDGNGTQQMILRVSVHDSGTLDEQVLELFELESDINTNSNIKGHDLNLRFVSTIVPLIGGGVSAQGSPLGGHEVQLDWPVGVSPDHYIVDRSCSLAQYHIHVFDYVQLSAESIAKTLARAGASVEFSATPAHLIECIREHQPHVLVYAEQRGHVVNHEILEKVLRYCDGHIAICVVANYGDDLSHPQFDHPDVQAIVTKPIRSTLLVQGVQQAVSRVQRSHVQPSQNESQNESQEELQQESQECQRRIRSIERPQILVIDDDLVVLHLVADLLSGMGVDVETTESGAQGLYFLSRYEFDLVIVDVQMPDMNGFEVTQDIRATYGDMLPILGLTASEASATREKALQVGMSDYLIKPVDRELLVQKVSAWVHLPDLDVPTKERQVLNSIDEETPEINVREAIRLLGQDQEIFTRSLLRFYGRFGGEGKAIISLLEDQRVDHIIKRLHGLRGGASNIGAYHLRDTIFSLEKSLRQAGDTDQTQICVQEVVSMLDKVLVEAGILLKHFLDQECQQSLPIPLDSFEEELHIVAGRLLQ